MEEEELTEQQKANLFNFGYVEDEQLTPDQLTAQWPHKHTGTVKRILFNIDKPLAFSMMDIELNKLTVMTGMNGTGKSFVMACVWAMTMVGQSYVMAKMLGQQMVDYSQYILDKTFKDQNINGIIKVIFESGCTVRLIFKEGKVQAVECKNFDHISIPQKAQFMSADMRTFNDMAPYMQLRQILKRSKGMAEMIDELTKTYRLYDVMYMEDLIGKMPIPVPPDVSKQLTEKFDFKENITDICLDESRNEFYAVTNEGNKYLTTLGKGHQSVLNMMMGHLPGTPTGTIRDGNSQS